MAFSLVPILSTLFLLFAAIEDGRGQESSSCPSQLLNDFIKAKSECSDDRRSDTSHFNQFNNNNDYDRNAREYGSRPYDGHYDGQQPNYQFDTVHGQRGQYYSGQSSHGTPGQDSYVNHRRDSIMTVANGRQFEKHATNQDRYGIVYCSFQKLSMKYRQVDNIMRGCQGYGDNRFNTNGYQNMDAFHAINSGMYNTNDCAERRLREFCPDFDSNEDRGEDNAEKKV